MSDGTEQQFLIVRVQPEDEFLLSSNKGEVKLQPGRTRINGNLWKTCVFFVNSTRRGRRTWRWL